MAFLAPLAPIMGALGVGVQAIGSVSSGLYQGQVAKNNAEIATMSGEYAREAGSQEADVASRKGAVRKGQVKTALAASGIDVNTGSAVDVQEGEAEANRLDIDTILHNADLRAYGYTTQAENFEHESKHAVQAGFLNAAGDLLGGASSLGFKWREPEMDVG